MQVRDAMQFVNEQDAATRERFIERLEFRATDPTFVAYREAYLELIDLPRAAAVLDLGCGTGVVARAIAARGWVRRHRDGGRPEPGLHRGRAAARRGATASANASSSSSATRTRSTCRPRASTPSWPTPW